MAKGHKKSTNPDYKSIAINGLVDLIVGLLLLLIGKHLD